MKKQRICLVSPGHVASNPRLVKEANALQDAGYQVKVVAGDYMEAIRPLDKILLSQVSWSWVQVNNGSKLSYIIRRLKQEIARKIVNIGWIPNLFIAIWAHSPITMKLAKLAAQESADLYIAHCLAALPAAAIAAKKHNAKLGFDAEDFHVGELIQSTQNQGEIKVRDYIERTLLPHCQHLTAASPKIAAAYTHRYGVSIESILNVFPLSEAPKSSGTKIGKEYSLYWFSQTIGTDRGLEAIVQAMSLMKTPVCLYLRGIPAAGYKEELTQLAQKLGIGDRITFLPPAPPSEMAQLAASYDIGLSLEITQPFNRAICLTNKIFTYLLAGIPVLMSSTPAQQDLAEELGEVAVLIDIHQPQDIANKLDKLFSNPQSLKNAQIQAQKLRTERYNWDLEKSQFLKIVEQVL